MLRNSSFSLAFFSWVSSFDK